ncbi:MAG: d(CMP) kinase [Pseudomonadota bacterium]
MAFCVAIDGPAASGKGTISRALAKQFGFGHLDTGLLYRSVARMMLQGQEPIAAAQALSPDDMSDPAALRGADIAQAASRVAAMPEVREALVDFQRAFAARLGGAVLDGRDIGTVICPDADVKLFVTARPEVRALRRTDELIARGDAAAYETVLADIHTRDARDADRAIAPMVAAPDAVLIDTSDLSIGDAIAQAADIVATMRARV